jgi:hypothetical protein
VSDQNFGDTQSVYVRLVLLTIAWATAGVLLYALFTFTPRAIQVTVAAMSWLIVVIDDFEPRKNKSLASYLCGFTGILIYVCSVVSTVFAHWHEEVCVRLIIVGVCLAAGLILLDRRANYWSL